MAQATWQQASSIPATNFTPHVMMAQQPAPPLTRTELRQRHKITLHKLGIVEVVLGSISCTLAIVAMAIVRPHYRSSTTYSAQGIWCGLVLIVSGILGIQAKKQPTRCIYNSNMVLSIIAANFMGVLVILSGIATVTSLEYAAPIHTILAVIGFSGMVVAITHSAYCCAGVCCQRYPTFEGTVAYIPQHQYIPQQMVQLPNGQLMLVQPQPIMIQGHPFTSASVPVPGAPIASQAVPTQQSSLPPSSTGVQGTDQMTKEEEAQMQGAMGNSPGYM